MSEKKKKDGSSWQKWGVMVHVIITITCIITAFVVLRADLYNHITTDLRETETAHTYLQKEIDRKVSREQFIECIKRMEQQMFNLQRSIDKLDRTLQAKQLRTEL